MARPWGNKACLLPGEVTIDNEDNGYDGNLIFPTHPVSDICIGDMTMNNGTQDEIVVRFANNDGEPKEEALPLFRKRSDAFGDPAKDNTNESLVADESDDEASSAPGRPATAARSAKGTHTTHSRPSAKGVIIGYWRESTAPGEDKHIVKGFIDTLDRLRIHAQPCNREGKDVTALYPLNLGPGGGWITFEKIVFDNHLVRLDQAQVKEYVKIRSGMKDVGKDSSANDKVAVQQAIKNCTNKRLQRQVYQLQQIAYGVDIPDHALQHPQKRRRNGATSSANPTHAAKAAPATSQPKVADLHGTRPTKVLLGFWKGSSERDDKDKHAVFGIISTNDKFRVKLGRETRDGRPLQSNFPSGAGTLWLSSDKYQIEWNSKSTVVCASTSWAAESGPRTRMTIGSSPSIKRADALLWASSSLSLEKTPYFPVSTAVLAKALTLISASNKGHTLARPVRPALVRAANRSSSVHFRINDLAVDAVAHVEARQTKNDQREAARLPRQCTQGDADGDASGQSFVQHNASRPNRVWADQDANRLRDSNDDNKIHMGIKYEHILIAMDVIAHENPSPEPVVAELGVCPEVEIIPVISDKYLICCVKA
ncbi:hypothetical protein F5883DRAFT_686358 [Diaporthe sp. PMI_573]|nr:hypothetical protein F5883DRAFT_686358 [Diaporthaceae sp. PMI_573]